MGGAVGGAALALPLPEARRGRPHAGSRATPSTACRGPTGSGREDDPGPDCSFASFSPDGPEVALATPRGHRDPRTARTAAACWSHRPGSRSRADAWHPDGDVLLASGPAARRRPARTCTRSRSTGHDPAAAGHPGPARAAFFSPDGRKVAFTYLNRYLHQVCMADWTGGALVDPRNLLPVDARERARSSGG